jgi:hypothetical protein
LHRGIADDRSSDGDGISSLSEERSNQARSLYCESSSTEVADYVVKLRGGMDWPNGPGPVCELYASMLAKHFGIFSPSPPSC